MTTNADVTIAEVIETARHKRALLTPETAGYLVLEAADQLLHSPVLVDEHLCSMQVEGGRITMLSRRVAHPLDAERGLRQLLRRLLEVSSGRAPALANVASLPPRGDLAGLVAELESALIPVNRGAATRALSRLARETVRARRPSVAPDAAPVADISRDAESIPPGPGDDTEPMQVAVDVGPVFDMTRDSQETLDRHLTPDEKSLPRFPLDASSERVGRASDASAFLDEPETARREPIEARASQPSADNVQDLLDDCLPSSPPPPDEVAPRAAAPMSAAARIATPQPGAVLPQLTPAPAPSDPRRTPAPAAVGPLSSPTPPPAALPAVTTSSPSEARARAGPAPAPESDAHAPEPPRDPVFSSFPPSSARGVDELLQDFLSSTSRKQDRVAQDLRRMAGVEGVDLEQKPSTASRQDESPFPNAGGSTDFYTSTPPPRAATPFPASHVGEESAAPRRARRWVYAMFTVVILAALGGVALLRFEPGFLSGRTPSIVEQERRVAAEAASALAAKPPQVCRATIIVSDVPQGAEILVRSGIGPVDVERVPAGARLEFVALADGYVPRRGVIPQGANWDAPNGKPRFELPIQLEKSHAKNGTLDPWPAAEPGTVVGGQGVPGTVHVVTSPRGAEVWMVAGGGPEAKLESLPCGAGLDLLVAGAQQGQPIRRRLRVEAARLTPEPSANTVTAKISAAK